jgi:hypothetical protein
MRFCSSAVFVETDLNEREGMSSFRCIESSSQEMVGFVRLPSLLCGRDCAKS